jgi:tripartite-type tricarboxylate transporter receptor subunit TctC
MKFSRRQFLCLAAGAETFPVMPRSARAQTYPVRPVTLIVPFAAGGSTDPIARIVAEGMRKSLGQPIIVENIAGGQGTIGIGRLARSAPDGYTIDIGQWDNHVVSGATTQLPYDLSKDFTPIGLIATTPWVIVARKFMPADDLKGLVARLKANSEKASQAIPTAGVHVAGALFQKETGTVTCSCHTVARLPPCRTLWLDN